MARIVAGGADGRRRKMERRTYVRRTATKRAPNDDAMDGRMRRRDDVARLAGGATVVSYALLHYGRVSWLTKVYVIRHLSSLYTQNGLTSRQCSDSLLDHLLVGRSLSLPLSLAPFQRFLHSLLCLPRPYFIHLPRG